MVCEIFISETVCVFLTVVGHHQNFEMHLSWIFADLWEDQITLIKHYFKKILTYLVALNLDCGSLASVVAAFGL